MKPHVQSVPNRTLLEVYSFLHDVHFYKNFYVQIQEECHRLRSRSDSNNIALHSSSRLLTYYYYYVLFCESPRQQMAFCLSNALKTMLEFSKTSFAIQYPLVSSCAFFRL